MTDYNAPSKGGAPNGAHRAEDERASEPFVVGPAGEEPVRGEAGDARWSGERVGEETAAPAFEEPMVEEVERPGEPEDVEHPYEEETPARPAEADDLTVEHLIDPDEADRFHGRWRDVKAGFVDDPSDALRQASALSEEVVLELTSALRRVRQSMDDAWQEGETSDTERMRVALRGYGSLLERILTPAR